MSIPVGLFSVLVLGALVLVAVAPVVLLALWVRDRHNGALW